MLASFDLFAVVTCHHPLLILHLVFGCILYIGIAPADGQVYLWDMRTRKCRETFADVGSLGTTALAVDRNYVATGLVCVCVPVCVCVCVYVCACARVVLFPNVCVYTCGMWHVARCCNAMLPPAGRSTSGVVNIYNQNGLGGVSVEAGLGGGAAAPTPTRELMHLTTTVDSLRFNHDSQILAMVREHVRARARACGCMFSMLY